MCRRTSGSVAWDEPVEQGSILFTAAADDPFSHEYEARRRVCTSAQENVKEQQQEKVVDLQDDIDNRCQDLHISPRFRQPLSNIVNRGTTELSQVHHCTHFRCTLDEEQGPRWYLVCRPAATTDA